MSCGILKSLFRSVLFEHQVPHEWNFVCPIAQFHMPLCSLLCLTTKLHFGVFHFWFPSLFPVNLVKITTWNHTRFLKRNDWFIKFLGEYKIAVEKIVHTQKIKFQLHNHVTLHQVWNNRLQPNRPETETLKMVEILKQKSSRWIMPAITVQMYESDTSVATLLYIVQNKTNISQRPCKTHVQICLHFATHCLIYVLFIDTILWKVTRHHNKRSTSPSKAVSIPYMTCHLHIIMHTKYEIENSFSIPCLSARLFVLLKSSGEASQIIST